MNAGVPPLTAPAQQQSTPFASSFSRRYACDRCRGHKLRCNRDLMAPTDSPCQRCRKARAKCTIGSSSSRRGAGPGASQGRLKDRPREGNLPNITTLEAHVERAQATVTTESSRPSPKKRNFTQPVRQSSWDAALDGQSPNDSMRSDSLSWQDVFGPGFDGAQEVHFGNAAATLPTLVSPSDVMLSNTPANQPTVASTYPFSSSNISDNFKSNPPFHVSANLAAVSRTDRDSAGVMAPNRPNEAGNPRFTEDEPQLLGSAHEQSPLPLEDRDTLSGHRPEHGPIDGSGISLAAFKDKNIQTLSDLSASLMKDLHRIVACESASSFLFTRSDRTAAEYLFKTMDGTTNPDNAIGRMLHGSERFLEIVQSFNQPPPTPSYPFSEQSTDGENYNYSRSEEIPDASETSLEARMEERWKIVQSYFGRSSYIAGDSSTDTRSTGNAVPRHQQKTDVPSTFAILTCYTCILKIYESVFSVIHLSLEVSRSWVSAIKLPQTITGLHINGFMLQNHRGLQIKILIQVSTYMLDSVEKALGGMLSDSMFQALLKTSLQQEGQGFSHNNETGMRTVRDMMKKIEEMLK